MTRIQIELPDIFLFSVIIPVRITDINYGNHLGNDALLSILHEARVRFLDHYGYTEFNVEDTGIIMAEVHIQYKSEALYKDLLMIEIAVSEFSRHGFNILYKVSCDTRIVAIARTGIVCYDYVKKKIAVVPEKFKHRLQEVQGR